MKLIRWAAAGLSVAMVLLSTLAQTVSPWEKPAASLAGQIAAVMGPGQARLTIQNISGIQTDAIPSIRRLLEQDLKVHGITLAEDESANLIRVTLSENAQERIWIAEVVEGNGSQVAMVELGPPRERPASSARELALRLQQVFTSPRPVLATLETPSGLIVLEPDEIVLYVRSAAGLREQSRVAIEQKRPLPRDPRGILSADESGRGFEAWLAGTECEGPLNAGPNEDTVDCRPSDDPWPVTLRNGLTGVAAIENLRVTPVRAFYNPSRDYFTGVLIPSTISDLPPFFSFAELPRSGGTVAWLVNGIDGKIQSIEGSSEHAIAGTRDWGSDFAVMHSGCGSGAQIVASGSGEASMDSLRAYELPAFEAIPVSAPLEVSGTVMALWPAPDGMGVYAVVRRAPDQYEVDRVTALCN